MSALLILAPLAPLLAALAAFVAPARPAAVLLVLSAIPGVAAGLAAAGAQAELPGLLFGAALGLAPSLAPGMAAVALLWGLAALHAMGAGGPAAEDGPAGARFRVCMGLAAAGQMGVFVAQDMATFYVAFAALSFAGYGLVRHKPTPEARRAARVYIAFVVIGELALFAALALINVAQNGLGLPAATGVAPPEAAWWLLAIGFGAKAGLVPLHVWLPLAHPVAPVPASAALSGGTLKAGLVGLMLFLPEGAAPAGFGAALVAAGFVGAFGAAVWGVLQRDAKVVLAYSSVSQMGLALAVTGAASAGWTPPGAAAAAVGLFIVHHALAKGVLFLSVEPGAPRGAALALAAFCALSMVGAPLTMGYAVKQALGAAAPALADALSLSAWGTAALMARALFLLRAKPGGGGAARGVAVGAAAAALLAAPFAAGVDIGGSLSSLASALPAVVVGALAVALSASGRQAPTLPAGDLVALYEGLAAAGLRFALAAGEAAARLRAVAASAASAAGAVVAALAVRLADPGPDDEQARWRMAGLTLAVAFAALSAAALGF
jgi:formate hydrogenlyase subunit 3/multisubunit Na+/H+ antiporter MnhD subunit